MSGQNAKYLVSTTSTTPVAGTAVTISAQLADASGNPMALPGQGWHYSEVTIMSALWRHGPEMLTRMRQAKIGWPRFNNAQQLADLVAYLNTVE